MLRIRTASLFALAVLIVLPQSAWTNSSRKNLVLIGGALSAERSPEILTKIIELSGGANRSLIGIITGASVPENWDRFAENEEDARNSRANARYYQELFLTAGAAAAEEIWLDLDHIERRTDAEVLDQVRSCTGFFFGGGDQSRLVEIFLEHDGTESPVLQAIKKEYEKGAVVAGTSAGAAVMVGKDRRSHIPMIAGGRSYDALVNGPYLYTRYVYKDDGSGDLLYDPRGGLGFFSYGLVDTHFSARGRQGRVIRLAYDLELDTVYGLDENTALVVTGADSDEVQMEVLGENGIWILDLSRASRVRKVYDAEGNDLFDLPYKAIFGARANYLTKGDRYDPIHHRVQVADWKRPTGELDWQRPSVRPSRDVFAPEELLELATDLIQCRCETARGITAESNPTFEVKLSKDATRGYGGLDSGGTWSWSFEGLTLDVYPVIRAR
jgi:cyanophycinase